MTLTVVKLGDSQGFVFDPDLMERAGLKIGDFLNVELLDNGTISLKPVRGGACPPDASQVIRQTVGDYSGTLKKLS